MAAEGGGGEAGGDEVKEEVLRNEPLKHMKENTENEELEGGKGKKRWKCWWGWEEIITFIPSFCDSVWKGG